MKNPKNVVICPPCGEQSLAPEGFNPGVAVATKEGQNRKKALWPLLPRLTAVLPPQGREMFRGFTARFVIPQGRYAGYSGRTGFTLIELLVVVLIIGILAAVAVPQYQKAVLKARTVELINVLNVGQKAIDAWVLENGYKDATWEDFVLDIPVPSTLLTGVSCEEHYQECSINAVPDFGGNVTFTNSNFEWTRRSCSVATDNDEIVCNQLKQTYPDMTIDDLRN